MDLRALIEQVAAELGITLTDSEVDMLVDFFNQLKAMDIDWNQIKEQLNDISTFLQSEEGQSFFQKLQDVLNRTLDDIRVLFSYW